MIHGEAKMLRRRTVAACPDVKALRERLSTYVGLPVTLEHDMDAVSGVVTNSRVAKDGSCWIHMETDDTPMGRKAEYHVDQLKWRSVSAGTFLGKTPDGTGVNHLYPYHVAIVETPGVETSIPAKRTPPT